MPKTARPNTATSGHASVRVIKKYPNRRLYDTQDSAYVTLAQIRELVLRHDAFEVRDAKTGDDVTRAILLQIILEAEAGSGPMFSQAALANMIRFHGMAMQAPMGQLIESNLQAMLSAQEKLQSLNPLAAGINPMQTMSRFSQTLSEQSEQWLRAWSGRG
jgi:polyhydroxyalkanoate synthesis repressor PhaR